MTPQTEAQRLADELEEAAGDYWRFQKSTGYGAAAELRRLARVEAQRDALLEVARKFVAWSEAERDHSGTTFWQRVEMCREVDALAHAAIKAVEEAN